MLTFQDNILSGTGDIAKSGVGTLTIEGDYVQEDSGSFRLEVDSARSDRFHVTGAMMLDGDLHLAFDPSDKMVDQA